MNTITLLAIGMYVTLCLLVIGWYTCTRLMDRILWRVPE